MRVVNDRRGSTRVTVRGEAFLHTPQGSLRCRCLDISHTGMSMVSAQAIKARQRVRVDSSFKGQRLVLEALVVRRTRTREGHVLGLRFEGLGPEAKQQLEVVLRSMQVQATLAQQSCGLVDRLPTLQLPEPEPEPQTERSPLVERPPWPEAAAIPQPMASPMPAGMPMPMVSPQPVAGMPMPMAPSPMPGMPQPMVSPQPVAGMPQSMAPSPMPAGMPQPTAASPTASAGMPRPRVASPVPPAGMPRPRVAGTPRPVAASPVPSVAPTLPPPIAPTEAEGGTGGRWWDSLEVPAGRRPSRAAEPSTSRPRWDSTMVAPSPVQASDASESPRWDSTMVAPSPAAASDASESPRWDSTMVAPSPVHPRFGLDEGWTEEELATTHYRPSEGSVPPPAPPPRPIARAEHAKPPAWPQPARAKPPQRAEAKRDEATMRTESPRREEPTLRTPSPSRDEAMMRTEAPRREEPTLRTPSPSRDEATRVEAPSRRALARRERVPTLEESGLDVDIDVTDIEVPDAIDCTEVEAKVGTIDVTEAPLPDWEPGAPVALAELVDTDAGLRAPAPSFDEVWEQLELADAPPSFGASPSSPERTLITSFETPPRSSERTLDTSFEAPPRSSERTLDTSFEAPPRSSERTLNTSFEAPPPKLERTQVTESPASLAAFTMVAEAEAELAAEDEAAGVPLAPARSGETMVIHVQDLSAGPDLEEDEPAAEWLVPIRTGETLAIHLEEPHVASTPIAEDELELPELTAPVTAPTVPRLSDELQAALDRLRRREDRDPEEPPKRRPAAARRHKRKLGATDVHATTRREDTQIRALYHAALADLGEPDLGDGS